MSSLPTVFTGTTPIDTYVLSWCRPSPLSCTATASMTDDSNLIALPDCVLTTIWEAIPAWDIWTRMRLQATSRRFRVLFRERSSRVCVLGTSSVVNLNSWPLEWIRWGSTEARDVFAAYDTILVLFERPSRDDCYWFLESRRSEEDEEIREEDVEVLYNLCPDSVLRGALDIVLGRAGEYAQALGKEIRVVFDTVGGYRTTVGYSPPHLSSNHVSLVWNAVDVPLLEGDHVSLVDVNVPHLVTSFQPPHRTEISGWN